MKTNRKKIDNRKSVGIRSRAIILMLPAASWLFMMTFSYAAGTDDPQSFTIPWYTIDGGGGSSEGGQFSVSGTIGQPDTGVMIGGAFEITGGYWSQPIFIPIPGDCNQDGVVDLNDYTCFFDCMTGPSQGLQPGCDAFDFDNDNDVDQKDFDNIQSLFGS